MEKEKKNVDKSIQEDKVSEDEGMRKETKKKGKEQH